ncbi:MAG: hypothetical protein WC736_15270 [Gallionella sp.]|jgi:hypothetical protein
MRATPFSGSGKLTAKAVGKLNSLMQRSEIFGGNNTSPLTRTPTGTIAQYRRRLAYREETTAGAGECHFQGTIDPDDPTKVLTHGGKIQIGSTPLTLGATGMYADTVSSTISATCWGCLTLDSSTAPTALTVTLETTYPSGAGKAKWPLWVAVFASGAVESVEQIYTGGDFVWPVRSFRWNETTGRMQGTYLLTPRTGIADFTASLDWFDIVVGEFCGGSGRLRDDLSMYDQVSGKFVKVKAIVYD